VILRVFEQIFKIQPTAQCIIYCWSFGHFTCYEMSMSRSTYIMIIKLFVCECTKDDDREVAALMSTRLWNFHIYVIVCLFDQGLDCSIASQIKSVFAEFPWVLMGHESIEWSEPTFTKLCSPSMIIHSDVLGMSVQDVKLGNLRRYSFAPHCAMICSRLITDWVITLF